MATALPWQESIAAGIIQRDVRERGHDDIIANYQKLAQYARRLKRQPTAPNQQPLPPTAAPTPSPAPPAATTSSTTTSTPASSKDLAAKDALIASLESQLATARSELSDLYKAHSQTTARLLTLSDQSHAHTALTQQLAALSRREKDLRDASGEKDRVVEMLQDELRTLSLELGQVEMRNDDLKRDNAALLKRWLDRARDEAERVNEANRYVEEVEERRRASGASGGPASPSPPS